MSHDLINRLENDECSDTPELRHEAAAALAAKDAEIKIAVIAERNRCLKAISDCPSLDENGYICEKGAAMRIILRDGPLAAGQRDGE